MTGQEIKEIIHRQRTFFYTGATLNTDFRKNALKRLRECILRHEEDIHEALKLDLGKSSFESYMCETGLVLNELSYMLRHIRILSRKKKVPTPLAQFHAGSYTLPSPYGVVLIMSPWNYPFLLTMEPLIDALAAGNTAVLKPGAYSPHTTGIILEIVRECFDPSYVTVVTGGHKENSALLDQHFDYIFFTGSQHVGKEVMTKAAHFLTPVTLELGGKSPCIVDQTADLKLAARRIVFGKFLNCGQTCVAPDYIYCHREIRDQLICQIQKQIRRQFGKEPLANNNYGKIINEKHFQRILGLIDKNKVVYGGKADPVSLQIEPTIMNHVNFRDKIMQEEIFGPVLPVLTYETLEEAVQKINSMAHPLALYIFSSQKKTAEMVLERTGFGGGCINDVVIHLATSQMGFGGFGESGMGAYHGKTGFDTFSHYKSIVDKKTWFDLPVRYQPYREAKRKLLKMFLK